MRSSFRSGPMMKKHEESENFLITFLWNTFRLFRLSLRLIFRMYNFAWSPLTSPETPPL